MVDVLLTADRTLINNYHLRSNIATASYGSPENLPHWLFKLQTRKPKTRPNGEVYFAPYPLRKMEAKIAECGFDVMTIAPNDVGKYIDDTKVLGINTVNPLGLGSMPSTRQFLVNDIDYSVIYFKQLLENKAIQRAKMNGLKIVVGGAGAWQIKNNPKVQQKLGIDIVVIGEGENIIKDVIKKCIKGEKLPKHVECSVEDIPDLPEISTIKNASNYGCIEIGRGCIRGCKFCDVKKNKVRWIPYENIEKELMINKNHGIKQGLLTAEDILLYGSNNVVPKLDKILKLIKITKKYYQKFHLTCLSMAAISAQPKVIPQAMELILEGQDFLLCETGIETGSERLLKNTMSGKIKPFKDRKWNEIVCQSMGILHDNSVIPYCSLILGLPGEIEEDIIQTLGLIDELNNFKCLFIPLNFTPLGEFANRKEFPININDIDELHRQVISKCFQHNNYWANEFVDDLFIDTKYKKLLKFIVNFWKNRFEKKAKKSGLLNS